MRSLPVLFLALLLAVASACRSAAPATPLPLPSAEDSSPASSQANTMGPGDMVEVRVFQEPDHSGIWRVSPEGTIDYPLCGKVELAGRTSSTAADSLRECLSRYLRRPQVSVLIREYNSKKIFVFGEVQKPGTFPYDGEMSIIQAITLAGGFTRTAAQNSTNVTRLVDGQERKIRVPVEDIGVGREKNFQLQPGDIVFVPESFF
ncbi:polysaccharide biosynthesis/export family protein [Hyalangium gracile]|uniref:polysaccharide biosynthesis/export family protein n=1 Tax=Hyalangium gracile TaxID=394092 RepID=UPI001CCA218A|nr:polysaccharide biosynthesis/export family protein [Hyalangium gracile]